MARIIQLTDMHVLPRVRSGYRACSTPMHCWLTLSTRCLPTGIKSGRLTPWLSLEISPKPAMRKVTSCSANKVRRLPAPYFLIPGNHDRRDPLRQCFEDKATIPPSGKINWVHDLADLRLIGLDTLIEGQGGGGPEMTPISNFYGSGNQHAANTRPILLAMHHPPFASGMVFMDQNRTDSHRTAGRYSERGAK